jgi:hypothetical protein
MESAVITTRNRVELRIVRSLATMADAWMNIGNSGRSISFPVRTQLGMPLTVIDGDDTVSLRYGRLTISESGHYAHSAKPAKKPNFGFLHYLAYYDVDQEAQERFEVKLRVPTPDYDRLWEMGARGNMPRMLQLQVKGLLNDGQWDLTETGSLLLIEEFNFSYLIDPGSTQNPA